MLKTAAAKRYKKGWFCYFITIFTMLGLVFVWQPTWAEERGESLPTFSVRALRESLGSVCERISIATGYEIILNEEWSDYPIIAEVHDSTVTDALRQMLKGFNFCLVEDSSKKEIRIVIIDKPSAKHVSKFSEIKEPQTISKGGIDEYAKEYVGRKARDNSNVIIADNMDMYAEQYAARAQKSEGLTIYAKTISDYADQYISGFLAGKVESLSIQADSVEEYAEKYVTRINGRQ